jgi:phosphatidylglycerophosphatase A
LIATWFGSGLLPSAPGTWGSLAALPPAWLIVTWGGWSVLLLAILAVFALGVWSANIYEAESGKKDPKEVVVDEVAGQWLTLLPAAIWIPELPGLLMASVPAFLLFRIFDIWKPWPVSSVEKRYRRGFGIMIDDIVAGLYAILVVILGVLVFTYLLR